VGFQLASLTIELTVVTIVVGVLLIASLIALAPLKKVRLPFTVALMLAGFAAGGVLQKAGEVSQARLAADILGLTPMTTLVTDAEPPEGDWRSHLDKTAQNALSKGLDGLTGDADATALATRLGALDADVVLHLHHAVADAKAAAKGEDSHGVGLLTQMVYMISVGGQLSPSMIFFVFLPPLVFESAFAMNARQLIKNIAPVCVLAVPVLILSTAITGSAVMLAGGEEHGLTWEVALLFGALISATDPVAVVALFKDLGAPKRLGVLVEGESLFNDGTAIVLFNILLAMAIASYAPSGGMDVGAEVTSGVLSFLKVAFGGIVVGLTLSWVTFSLIGRVTSRETVEISLTLVLAYGSFIIAEHFLHVSGVMAAVCAGLLAGSYGMTKVSPSVTHFMHEFWEYMGFIMNSLIFFFVGLVIFTQISLQDVMDHLPLLGAALAAVIVARAIGVFGTVPLLKRFVETIDVKFQAVMFWGGLRGAVSLALALIVFTHEDLPHEARVGVLVLSAGIVLFTLSVNALTMEPLIVALGLNKPTPVDRFALAYAEHERVEVSAKVLKRLEKEGAVLPAVLEALKVRHDAREAEAAKALVSIKESADSETGDAIAAFVALAVEKGNVLHRFEAGELTEAATKSLLASADLLLDAVKAGQDLPEIRTVTIGYGPAESKLLSLLEPFPVLGAFARGVRAQRLAEDVEVSRGLFLVARSVQRTLATLEDLQGLGVQSLAKVQARYAGWRYKAEERLHKLTEEYPEYAQGSQELLAELQTIRAEAKSLHHLAESGLMTEKALGNAKEELVAREAAVLARRATGIALDAAGLLRSVPAFADFDAPSLEKVAKKLVSRTFLEGEVVVKERDKGASMFLIARGAVGVSCKGDGGEEIPLSTLGCGAFFGEIAALLGGTRTATVRALTPVNLLELTRSELHAVLDENPEVGKTVRASIHPRAASAAFAHCPELAPLTQEQRDELCTHVGERSFAAGDVIVKQGAPCLLACVVQGSLKVSDESLGDGRAFGAKAFAGGAATEDVVAETDGLLLVVPDDALGAFRRANPSTADAVHRNTAPEDDSNA
jgi:monovalent cation:H+ antiporter, CPA1 family